MNDGQYAQSYDDRDGRERREQYAYAAAAHSPPPSASPFAFAPPPLSAVPSSSRPSLAMHHSEPAQPYNYYAKAHAAAPYAYAGSHPMGYRSVSNETAPGAAGVGRSSPSLPAASRTASFSSVAPGQPSPSASPYTYARPSPYAVPAHSPQARPGFYPAPYYPAYGQPGAVDMPRSLSYPSTYPTPYHVPGAAPPMGHERGGLPGQAPSLGYSFANRLPLVDRPFKCDECVQSFNRNHDLKRHKRIHLSVKPFGCDKCGKTFSRKDALRRHWLVKGCRGEDGATAPITPTFPLNGPPPVLSPPTPTSTISPTNGSFHASSYSHPGAPPPLTALPSRAPSDQSQLLLTPDELAAQQQHSAAAAGGSRGAPLDEPLVLDGALALPGHRASAGSLDGEGSYFDGVVGLRKDGTAMMGAHAKAAAAGADGKPVFAMPFAGGAAGPNGAHAAHAAHPGHGGHPGHAAGQGYLAAPALGGEDMEKQSSAGSDPQSWQRWHRPSFPFPTPGNGFGVDVNGAPVPHAPVAHAYAA